MAAEQQAALVATVSTVQAQLRDRLLALVLALFERPGSWRDADRDRFVAAAVPLILGAQRQMASLTDAYLSAMLSDMRGIPARPRGLALDPATIRGVSPSEVYARPFHDVWSELSHGADLSQAVAAGKQRAWQLATTDLQLAKTHAAAEVLSLGEGVVGYRRVLTGSESCGLCVVASTQRYHRGELMPIHPGCDCGVSPIIGTQDPGHVLDAVLLEQAHDAIEERFGVSNRSGRLPDYRNVIVTYEHGEIGPVLARKGDSFTGPEDLH